jgi:hypothetical protein
MYFPQETLALAATKYILDNAKPTEEAIVEATTRDSEIF